MMRLQKSLNLMAQTLVCALLLLIPVIVGLQVDSVQFVDSPNLGSWVNHFDLYRLFKARSLWFTGVLFFVLLILKVVTTYKFKSERYLWSPLWCCFLFSVCLSVNLAENFKVSLLGLPGIYFGGATLMSCILLAETVRVFASIAFIRKALIAAMSSSILVGLFAILERTSFGTDLFEAVFSWVGVLFEKSGANKISQGKNLPASTLYNANYLGVFSVIMLVLAVEMIRCQSSRILNFFLFTVIVFNVSSLAISSSEASMIIFGCYIIFLFLQFIKGHKRKQQYAVAGLFLLQIFLFMDIPRISSHILPRVERVLWEMGNIGITKPRHHEIFTNLEMDAETVRVQFRRHDLLVSYRDLRWFLETRKGIDELEVLPGQSKRKRFPKKYHWLEFYTFQGLPAFTLHFGFDKKMHFIKTLNGFRIYDKHALVRDLVDVPRIIPFGLHFLSARGYIWNGGLWSMKDHLIFGHGPDMFAHAFPQTDYPPKIAMFGTPEIVIDKPHSFYLQIFHGMGLVGFGILGLVFFQILRSCWKNHARLANEERAIYYAFTVWAFLGITNDLTLSVAPIVFFMIGVLLRKKAEFAS